MHQVLFNSASRPNTAYLREKLRLNYDMLCEVYRKSEYLLVWFSSKLSANLKCMIKHEMISLLSKCYHKFNLYVYFHCKEAGYYMYLHCLGRL